MLNIRDRITGFKNPSPLMIKLSLCLLHFLLIPGAMAGKEGVKTEVLPIQTAAPAVIVIQTGGSEEGLRRQMRAKNGVSGLSPSTAQARFSIMPTGSFAFITPRLLALALIRQSPDLPLEPLSPVINAYEIHKLADGSGMLVGFLTAALSPQLLRSQRPKNIRIGIYSNFSDQAPYIVAVPLVKLVVDQMPLRLDAKLPDGPVLLEMDLQGTANRKSSQAVP